MCRSSSRTGGGMAGGWALCQSSISASSRGFNVASNLRRLIARCRSCNGERVSNRHSQRVNPFLL